MGSWSLKGLWSRVEMCSASWPSSNIVSAESRDTCARLEIKQEAGDHVHVLMHSVHGEQNVKKGYAYFWEIERRQPSKSNSLLMEMNTNQSFLCLCLCVFVFSFPFLPCRQFYVFTYLTILFSLMQLSTEKCPALLQLSNHETSTNCALLMQFLWRNSLEFKDEILLQMKSIGLLVLIVMKLRLYQQLFPFSRKSLQIHTYTEYSEVEGAHRDHGVQLLCKWPVQGVNPQPWCY